MLLTSTPKHHISHMMLKGNDATLSPCSSHLSFVVFFSFGNIAEKAKNILFMCVSILLGGILQYPDVDMMDNK